MAMRNRSKGVWCAAAGLSLALAGCGMTPKNPLAMKPSAGTKSAAPATTAVSGSGEFAPDTGAKHPEVVHLAYAHWQEQMGQQAEARESFSKVLADHPKNIEAILGLARLDQSAGLYSDAEEKLKKALKLAPKDPRVYATYGNFYSAQGDWNRAVEKQQVAVKQAPDDPRYQYLLGVALARSGNVDASYEYFVRSVGDAQAHYNLGFILQQRGDRAGAMQHYERALAIKPDLQVAQTMLENVQQRGDNTILANGTDRGLSGAMTTPASSVRSIPLTKQEELVPLQGNEASLPRATYRAAHLTPGNAPSAPSHSPQLSPAQLEQLRNQQGQ